MNAIKSQYTHFQGFTLIELMVVMAIMATAFSLVGPNILRAYDKAKSQIEITELKETIKKISYKAFVNGRIVVIFFHNEKIQYQYENSEKIITKSFNHITFPEQQLEISTAGFANLSAITVNIANIEQVVSLVEARTL